MNPKPCAHLIAIGVINFYVLLMGNPLFSREFTSVDGKKMEATIVALQGENVVLKRGVKQYTLPVNRLSKDDQIYIEEWGKKEAMNMIPKLKFEISSGKLDRSDKQDSFDNSKGRFQISIKITNEEIHYDLKKCRLSVSVIGEDCADSKRYGIMQKSSVEVNTEPGKSFTWKGDALNYKFDDSYPVFWGSKYYGYVLQLKNAQGKVIYKKAMPLRFEKDIAKILNFSNLFAFGKKMESRGKIRIYTID